MLGFLFVAVWHVCSPANRIKISAQSPIIWHCVVCWTFILLVYFYYTFFVDSGQSNFSFFYIFNVFFLNLKHAILLMYYIFTPFQNNWNTELAVLWMCVRPALWIFDLEGVQRYSVYLSSLYGGAQAACYPLVLPKTNAQPLYTLTGALFRYVLANLLGKGNIYRDTMILNVYISISSPTLNRQQ